MCSGGTVNTGATEGICEEGSHKANVWEQCVHVILRDAALCLSLSVFVHRQCCGRGVYMCTYNPWRYNLCSVKPNHLVQWNLSKMVTV